MASPQTGDYGIKVCVRACTHTHTYACTHTHSHTHTTPHIHSHMHPTDLEFFLVLQLEVQLLLSGLQLLLHQQSATQALDLQLLLDEPTDTEGSE